MANLQNADPAPGVDWWTLDTTNTTTGIELGQAAPGMVGSFTIYVQGTGWTGVIIPRTRPLGSVAASFSYVAVAYQNAASGADVAAGTNITADGKFFVRVDHNEILNLSYTNTAGSCNLLVIRGKG